MSATILALAGYILWTMMLLLLLAGYRTAISKQQGTLKFAADGSDVPDVGHRITRAQANCAESFVFIGGTMLLALTTQSAVITDGLAFIVLGARILQSITHLLSQTQKNQSRSTT